MTTNTKHNNTCNYVRKLACANKRAPSKRYIGYIRSPNWLTRRRKHMAAYPYCQIPGCAKPAIQVHHWSYKRLGDEHAMDLCSICLHHHHQMHCLEVDDDRGGTQGILDL